MNKKLITALRFSIILGIALFSFYYLRDNFGRFADGAHFTPQNISLLIILNILTISCESMRLRFMVKKMGCNLNFIHSWNLLTLFQAANHMVTKAGTVSGGYYLSRKYKISLHSYIALVVTYVVIMLLASGIFGLIVTLIFITIGYSVSLLVLLFFIGIIFSTAAFIGIASLPVSLGKLPQTVKLIFESWREIYTDFKFVAVTTFLEMFYFFFGSLRFMVAVSMFSEKINLSDSVVVVAVGNFLRVAAIIPGGLGVAEIASGWTAGILGGDPGLTAVAAGLDRLVYVSLIMFFGGIGFLAVSDRKEFHMPPKDYLESD